MSEQTIRRTGRIVDIQATMPWLVAAGVYVLLLALGPRMLADPDTYSHVALGRWMLDHHTVPTTDPFSATLRGTHWVAFEWLSQITFAAAYAIGGWTAVVVLPAAAVSIAIGILTRFLLREWQPTATLAAVLIAFLLTAPHILARPHILALPIMVAWITTLIRAVDTRSAPPLLLLPATLEPALHEIRLAPPGCLAGSLQARIALGEIVSQQIAVAVVVFQPRQFVPRREHKVDD